MNSPRTSHPATPDALIRNAGSTWVFCPLSARAKLWFREHVQSEAWQWLGATLVVDHLYAWGLSQGIRDAGPGVR